MTSTPGLNRTDAEREPADGWDEQQHDDERREERANREG